MDGEAQGTEGVTSEEGVPVRAGGQDQRTLQLVYFLRVGIFSGGVLRLMLYEAQTQRWLLTRSTR